MKLDINEVRFHYLRGRDVFRGVSLSVGEGDCLSILGVNGAGKSTLLNCIAGLHRPNEGDILLDGRSVFSMSRNEISRRVGYVPQIHDSSFAYTVLEYVVMGRAPYIPPYGMPDRSDYALARKMLERVGLAGMEDKVFTEMSGGEQQLAVVARVLTQEAKLILLDEPTNHLDYGNQHRVIGILRSLSADGYTIIMTTHNPDHALMLGGKAAILAPGGGILTGPAEEILTAERLSDLYGLEIGVSYLSDAGRKLCYIRADGRESRG